MFIAAQIASDLGMNEQRVVDLSNEVEYHYNKFLLGGRRIDEPLPELKLIQRWISDFVTRSSAPVPPYVTAYERGSSIVENAKVHSANSHIASFDIKGFFHSCTAGEVKSYFESLVVMVGKNHAKRHLTTPECALLTRLSCYRGSLPMGAPSSPVLANRVFGKVDLEILSLLPPDCAYTRYSDDICISSNRRLDCDVLEKGISIILKKYGFALNSKKTHVSGKGSARKVTGVYILEDGSLSLGKTRKKEYIRALYQLLVHGNGNPREVMGMLNFCKQVDPDYFVSLVSKFSSYGYARERGGVLPAIFYLMGYK